jgi:hypothetical protein
MYTERKTGFHFAEIVKHAVYNKNFMFYFSHLLLQWAVPFKLGTWKKGQMKEVTNKIHIFSKYMRQMYTSLALTIIYCKHDSIVVELIRMARAHKDNTVTTTCSLKKTYYNTLNHKYIITLLITYYLSYNMFRNIYNYAMLNI